MDSQSKNIEKRCSVWGVGVWKGIIFSERDSKVVRFLSELKGTKESSRNALCKTLIFAPTPVSTLHCTCRLFS